MFLWSRHVSTEQSCFYGAAKFLQSESISTEQACFYQACMFLPSMHISMEQVYFYGADHTSMKNEHAFKVVKSCPLWATVLPLLYHAHATLAYTLLCSQVLNHYEPLMVGCITEQHSEND